MTKESIVIANQVYWLEKISIYNATSANSFVLRFNHVVNEPKLGIQAVVIISDGIPVMVKEHGLNSFQMWCRLMGRLN